MGQDTQTFQALSTRFVEEYLLRSPEEASGLGDTTYDAALSDLSAAGIREYEKWTKAWLAQFNAVDPATLTEDEEIDRELALAQLGKTVKITSFAVWKRDPTFYLNDGIFVLFLHHNRREPTLLLAVTGRLKGIPERIAVAQQQLEPSMMVEVLIRERAIPFAHAQAAFLRDTLPTFFSEDVRSQIVDATKPAVHAYESFAKYLLALLPTCTGSFVFGEERYDAVLAVGERLPYTTRTLRALGEQQFAMIEEKMATLSQQISGSPDWKALCIKLQQQHPKSMEAMLDAYRTETERARAFVVDREIMTLPERERCVVEPAPGFMRASAPVASYFSPPAIGPKGPGQFNVPYTTDGASKEEDQERLESNADYLIPAVTVHEAYPGHHLHLAVATATSLLRQVLTSVYFIEGWGLYVEQMMKEQGYYEHPEDELGQLNMRLFRAGRIIVDTGLHLGEMSFDEAVTFMHERVGFPAATARGEVRRYCAWPTQASAYLTGALAIESLHQQWMDAGRGSLQDFHDAIASTGMLPLGIAAQAIDLPLTSEDCMKNVP